MELVRQIGKNSVLIDTADPCGISLSEELLQSHGYDHRQPLTKKQLLSMLANGDDYFPLSLQWEVLDRCNFHCPFCYIVGHSDARMVRLVEIKPYIREFINEGLLFCTLTGGEVTLHPDFLSIYRLLRESGVVVDIFTNGSVLSDAMLETYAAFPPRTVEISIYSLCNQRIKKVCGVKTNTVASIVMMNVLKLHQAGVRVICKTFVNAMTVQDADEIANWCNRHGLEHYSSTEITWAYDGDDLSEFRVRGEPHNLKILRDGKINVGFPCGTRNYGAHLNAYFQMNPCPALRLPESFFDVRVLGVKECVKQVKQFLRTYENMPIRKSCDNQVSCSTCIAYATPIRDVRGRIIDLVEPVKLVR